MKKQKLFVSTLSAISAATIVAPLAMVATGCSCSNRFAGDDVNNGVYTPDFNVLGGSSAITLSKGTEEYWKFLADNKNVPYEEFRWTCSSIVAVLKDTLQEAWGVDEELPIKFNKWNAKLSDFKFTDKDNKRVSYTVTQDIDLDLDMKQGDSLKLFNDFSLTLSGHIKLAWHNEVKNLPIGCFDFDPSGMIGQTIYPNETLWYVGPDLSSIEVGDDSWSINYDIVPDIDLYVNGENIITLNNEIKFRFDKTLAGIIESFFTEDELPIAYFAERILGLMVGWNSYYLSKTEQLPHIDWGASGWSNDTTDIDGNYQVPSFGRTPIFNYKIADASYKQEDVYSTIIGLSGEKILDILPKPVFSTQGVSDKVVGYKDNVLSVAYNFLDDHPEGTTFADLGYGYNVIVPVIITKDWISLGGLAGGSLINLRQGAKNIVDVTQDSQLNTKGSGKETIGLRFSDTEGGKNLFKDWKSQISTGKCNYVVEVVGGEGNYPVVIDSTKPYDLFEGEDGHNYLRVNVQFDELETQPAVDAISDNFQISITDKSMSGSGGIWSNSHKLQYGSEYVEWSHELDEYGHQVLLANGESDVDFDDWAGCIYFDKDVDTTKPITFKLIYGDHDVVNTNIQFNGSDTQGDQWTLTNPVLGSVLYDGGLYKIEITFTPSGGSDAQTLYFNEIWMKFKGE